MYNGRVGRYLIYVHPGPEKEAKFFLEKFNSTPLVDASYALITTADLSDEDALVFKIRFSPQVMEMMK